MSELNQSALPAPAPGAPPSGLAIHLFGPMTVRIGPHPLPRLRSRKGLWLLALLALRAGRPVERDWLAATLWPEDDEAAARRSLRQSLHDLRLALGPEAARLTSEGPRTLRLDVDGASVDVLAFDAALERGDLASLEAAVRQHRGPLLEDCAEAWSALERQRREQGYVTALGRLAAAATGCQEHAAAASYLRTAVAADPYREDLQRELMQALAASGSPADALLVYREYRSRLAREMAAEPGEETTALFRRLREETRARARPRDAGLAEAVLPSSPIPSSFVPRRLPLPLTALIGRDEAVQEIISRFASARLVTLTGTGGIGKTRLALQVAEELADDYEDGAAFVDFAPLADPGTVPEALRAALGVSEAPAAGGVHHQTLEVLRQHLSARRLLLVLDNCEHLLSACAALAGALLGQCPGLRILATSRQALGLPGETVWPVPSLALPALPEPSSLAQCASVRLFLERARAVEASFEVTPRNAPAIVQVCRRLDGIPLAIELAAARVRSLSVEEIDTRLRDGFGLLTSRGPALLPRQQTLAATFDWSWNLLSPAERTLLRRLSVFAGGWTLEAAEAVCADGGSTSDPSAIPNPPSALRKEEVLDLLTSLVDRSLVNYHPARRGDQVTRGGGGEARYHLLEPVRQYAADRLRESNEREATQNRHRDFFLLWTERIEPKLSEADQALWFSRLEADHDNLRRALAWGLESDPELSLRMASALVSFWDTRGYRTEGGEMLERALLRAVDAPAELRALVLNKAGSLARRRGEFERATAYLKDSLELAQRWGDQNGISSALYGLGRVAVESGRYEEARLRFEAVLGIWRTMENPLAVATVLNSLGDTATYQGNYDAAHAYLQESLQIWSQAGNKRSMAMSLINLAILAKAQGDYTAAGEYAERSLELYSDVGDRGGEALVANTLGELAQAQNDPRDACSWFRQSMDIWREIGERNYLGVTVLNLGRALQALEQYGPARNQYEEALALFEGVRHQQGRAEALYQLGTLARAEGDPAGARDYFTRSQCIWTELREEEWIARCSKDLPDLPGD